MIKPMPNFRPYRARRLYAPWIVAVSKSLNAPNRFRDSLSHALSPSASGGSGKDTVADWWPYYFLTGLATRQYPNILREAIH
jgi:hypothetical protein